MICRLRLHNWRSYEDLDLALDPGTTFVVAPNGVGKTSLVYGLAWAVFGGYSDVDPKKCIRAGTTRAEVQVDLNLPDGRRLVITRSIKRRGGATATYKIDGKALSEKSAQTEMEKTLGVELPVAGRLAMMLGGGHLAAHRELDLTAHLHHAFGVSHLLSASQVAQSVAKDAVKARAALRLSTKKRLYDRSALNTEIASVTAEISRLEGRGVELANLRERAVAQRSLVERHLAIADQLAHYEQMRSQLIADAERFLGGQRMADGDKKSTVSDLRHELHLSRSAASEATEGIVAARSVINAAEEAVRLLNRDTPVCPTCMRPIATDERDSAISSHQARTRTARTEIEHFELAQEATRIRSRAVARLLTRLESLQPPQVDTEIADIPDRAHADAVLQEASTALHENSQKLGAAKSRLQSLRRQIESNDQIQQEERDLRLAYRREAIALASSRMLREAADKVIESRINPIANEVRWRWKQLFANGGLTLRSDGSMVRFQANEELGWDTFSGGERTWARIVTHLLVIASTTSLPFAWFDEPLEHLDPQFRHAVAATLATATEGGTPCQLLVTTYENTLARQLANDIDSAAVLAVRESGNYTEPSPRQPRSNPIQEAS